MAESKPAASDAQPPRPKLLDLFCCEGGASTGYHRAGFNVTGVDIEPRPKYPFEFVLADAMELLADAAFLDQFAVIAASPPCQMYSSALKHMAHSQPMLIDAVREALQGRAYVIENVPGSEIPPQDDLFGRHGVELCGTQFGMRIYRHRLFESSHPMSAPPCRHRLQAMNPHNVAGREWIYREFGRQDPEIVWRREMGVEWMSKHGGRESIPPAFTEHLGRQMLAHLAGSHRHDCPCADCYSAAMGH
jgi:DNA (cytosine-5)-methyltransferase 1